MGPLDFCSIKANVKVSSTENGIIFGNIVYDCTGAASDRNVVVLNDIHIDIMDYIVPAVCTEPEFRYVLIFNFTKKCAYIYFANNFHEKIFCVFFLDKCGQFLNGKTRLQSIHNWPIYMIIWNICWNRPIWKVWHLIKVIIMTSILSIIHIGDLKSTQTLLMNIFFSIKKLWVVNVDSWQPIFMPNPFLVKMPLQMLVWKKIQPNRMPQWQVTFFRQIDFWYLLHT